MDDESVSVEELSLDDKVAILMSQLPKPVQDFLHSPERDAVSSELSRKYTLHADQAGVFERSYIYMLLGVYTPDEFVQELRDAHISEDTVHGLTTDVNERVFKRLQSAERNPAPVAATPIPPPIPLQPKPVPPVPPAPAPFAPPAPPKPAPAAIPIYVPPVAPAPVLPAVGPSPFTPPPVSMPVPPPAPLVPAPVPPAPKPVFTTPPAPAPMPPAQPAVPPSTEHPAIRTMASDMQFMKEEVKHPHAAPVPPPTWQPAAPARTFQTSSVPNTAPAPQPVPFTPPAPMPPAPPAPRPFSMPTPPPNLPGQPAGTHPAPAAPIVKEYGVDPYRETPE